MTLTIDQIIHFHTKGYLVVENAFADQDLAPVVSEISGMIDKRARELKSAGKIKDLHEGESFERRYAFLHRQSPEMGRNFDIMHLRGEAMFRFLKNDNLLDVAECLLGSELSCNPIQHMRAKLPADERSPNGVDTFQNVPWHQDAAVTSEDSDHSSIITFWIPLVDATEETGCMELLPGAFKKGYLRHQAEGGTSIIPDELPAIEPQPVPCPRGGIVIMNKYTPHRGTTNRSDIIRWSLDLRYHQTGAPSGRPSHPSFVVRSKSRPGSVLEDYSAWCRMWTEALAGSKGKKLHRVSGTHG